MPPREKLGDLYKTSEPYLKHEPAIDRIRDMLKGRNNMIWRTIKAAQQRSGAAGNLPSPSFIDKPTHINCDGLQILHHTIGMEAFRRDQDNREAAELREPLRHIASVRISVMQYGINQRAIDYVSEITAIDEGVAELAPDAEVPALTPFLFRPETAMSQLKVLAGDKKFENPDILMNMGVLFARDVHILHSVCLSMINGGMGEHVKSILETRAAEEFGDARALVILLQRNPELFKVLVTALLETGKTDEVVYWCRQGAFSKLMSTDASLVERYSAALRNQGRFDDARRLLETARDTHGLRTAGLSVEYSMAMSGDRDVMKKKL